MISRKLKTAYYGLLRVPLRINGLLYRAFRSPSEGVVKVQLGPGQRNYLAGWINVDANRFTAKIDVWANLQDPLPFRDSSVDVFYSHHVIEHLPDSFLPTHCKEMYRCLKPGGFIRIGGPNGDSAARKSIGGRFANYLLCRGEHLTILTFSYLEELLGDAGFVRICRCKPVTETFHSALIDQRVLSTECEDTPDTPHTLIVEAEKPS